MVEAKSNSLDFFYTRTFFRHMTDYYTKKYKTYYDKMVQKNEPAEKRISMLSKDEVKAYLKNFVCSVFGEDILTTPDLTPTQKEQLILSMMIFVFSHRHGDKKQDKFIEQTRLEQEEKADTYFDFSILRNTMYNYSQKAQDAFLKKPVETFFMANFILASDSQQFIVSKQENKEVDKSQQILEKARQMLKKAMDKLHYCEEPAEQKMCDFFINFLDNC